MSTRSPFSAGNQPYAGISEFELPGRVPELAARILWDLIRPCRQQVVKAEKRRVAAINLADQALAHSKTRFNKLKAEQNLKTRKRQSSITSVVDEIDIASSTAAAHLESEGESVPTVPPPIPSESETSARPPLDLVDDLDEVIGPIKAQLHIICAIKKMDYFPVGTGGRLFYLILSVYNFSMYQPLVIVLPTIVFISRLVVSSQLESGYSNLLKRSYSLKQYLRTLESKIVNDGKTVIKQHHKELIPPAQQLQSEEVERANRYFKEDLQNIQDSFHKGAAKLHEDVDRLWKESGLAAKEWDSSEWKNWSPDPSPEFAARIGKLAINADDLRSKLPGIEFNFKLPAIVPFVEGRCLLLEATGKATETAAEALLSVMVRILANTPAGKARFTLIDPVGLGQNVADFMQLGDFNKDLICGKAWSEPQHIEHQLTLLTEHMETVIQTCLRNEFTSIRDYNRERHEVAQAYRFLVVYDFPANFTDTSARRLVSVVKNGPRCGVFTFILSDTEKDRPYGFNLCDLQDAATQIVSTGQTLPPEQPQIGGFVWKGKDVEDFTLLLDGPPPQDLTSTIVKKSGELAVPAMKVEVPFEKLLAFNSLEKNSWWTGSTTDDFKVPLGPAGARAWQKLTLGGEQEAHALMVGRTGSGKTNLMHVIITSLALTYPPQEMQLYLIDFKGGVGFKRYAEHLLPHAKVIAIESEREFGLSVLRGLDAELKQRSEMFRAAGVDNLTAYRGKMRSEKPDANPMPRILLIVDEFQEFFTDNDDFSQQAKIIFDRLARQGRSFGVHFLLATQSLSGSAQLHTSIMGQIKVRIALPCSEADSRLILADDNKGARALSIPGEAIYNSLGGLIEGNNRFQVARFSDDDLPKYLAAISEIAPDGFAPIIFEGNELAQVVDCGPLKELLLAQDWPQAAKSVEIFLGEPIAIMPPVTARLRRQSGANLMILTRNESEGIGMCMASLLNILTQQYPDTTRIYIADFTTTDSEWAEHAEEIARCFPGEISVVGRQREFTPMLATIANEVHSRSDNVSGQGSIYLILQGMHRIKPLRDDAEDEDGQNSVELLKVILRDGPEVGVHVVAWADTWSNVTRGLDRKTIGEFGLRVATVMDSGDSMNFLDDSAASKISKPYRAIFYDEDRPGQLASFRPYAMPAVAWLKETGQRLRARMENRIAD